MTKLSELMRRSLFGAPAWVFLLALAVRSAAVFPVLAHPDRGMVTDSYGYTELADSILLDGTFSSMNNGARVPDTLRTPVYPLFLAGLKALPVALPAAAAAAQCLLGAFAAALCWRWFSLFAPGTGAAIGAVAMCVDLGQVLHTPLVLTESLHLFSVVVFCLFFWEALSSRSLRVAGLAGLTAGISALIRPVSLYLPLALCPLLYKGKKAAVVFFAAFLLLPAAWTFRNYRASGVASFSNIGGINLLRWMGGGIEARLNGTTWSEAESGLRERIDAANGPYRNQAQQAAVYMKEAVALAKAHPVVTAVVCARGAVYILLGTGEEMIFPLAGIDVSQLVYQSSGRHFAGTLAVGRRYPWVLVIKAVYTVFLLLLYVFACRGLWRLFSTGRRLEAAFLACGMLYFLAVSANSGYYRFRLPMLPFLAAAAAAFIKKSVPSDGR